jgi:hypothetical protein
VQLTPFVPKSVGAKYLQTSDDSYEIAKKNFTADEYLEMWKVTGGQDRVDHLESAAETKQ